MVEKASAVNRGIAFLIDSIFSGVLLFLAGAVVLQIVSLAGLTPGPNALRGFVGLGVMTYFIYFEGRSGQTPAKMLLNMKVTKKDGSDCGYRASFIRNVLRIVDVLPQLYLVGLASIYLTEDDQRVGDLLAGTIVVKE